MTRKRPALVEGLAAGAENAGLTDLGRGLGDGLVRVSEAWLPKGKLALPQMCPLGCVTRAYPSTVALGHHLSTAHAGLSSRERSFVLDQARRTAVRQAMNGSPRPP